MDHNDHVRLLRPAGLAPGGVWADLGAGTGAFTLALRELVGAEAVIHAIDKNRGDLEALKEAHASRFGTIQNLHAVRADFTHALEVPPLDGVVMANSLHFHRDHARVLRHVAGMLKASGVLLLVEYNVDAGNLWVPHPLSFETFKALAGKAGFGTPRLLATVRSRFLREIYSAATRNAEGGP